jgi:hypothetical protein
VEENCFCVPSMMENGVCCKELFFFFSLKVTFFWVSVDLAWDEIQANKS